ncbi:hypothetical protein fugu_018315 [Takifugu bimaculatus]|uniref:BHLH domain-containing protein n=1 Tax=Takifugu bimaculatus TaxID=433685 RepID=A0A4Z2BKS7_9TELE|nr:hypothetical protein fugu_018315 [Takifugu bimaculatus]
MKRNHDFSSSDSELEETIEVEKESADENGNMSSPLGSMSPTTSTQVQARKRRRGIIEKRRRDRINNCLSELRRLVPSAFEKQGSAKLEKAEILQMTVDHLKMLHAAGGKGYFDAHALAMDYRSLGFRECLAETARYLSIIEGLDTADPLRLRLVSHLNNYASQREAHSGLSHLAWGSAFGSPAAHLTHPLLLQHQQHSRWRRYPAAPAAGPQTSPVVLLVQLLHVFAVLVRGGGPRLGPTEPERHPALRTGPSKRSPHHRRRHPLSTPLWSRLQRPNSHPLSLSPLSAFPFTFSAFPLIAPATAIGPSAPTSSVGKPYRPWGLEIGAF